MKFLGSSIRWIIAFCLGLSSAAGVANAQVHIEDLRVGFGQPTSGNEGNYKIGNWAPARVKVRAEGEAFVGTLELSTFDSDDVEAIFSRPMNLASNQTIDVPTFVKPGKMLPTYFVRLLDQEGKTRERRSFEVTVGQGDDGAPPSVTLIVALGHPAGLDVEQIAKRPGYPRERIRIAQLGSARELPARWFGFEPVDHLILCIDDPSELESLDVSVRSALQRWVQTGGHLVVSVGSSWDRVVKVLGPMLPAEIDRTETVKQLSDLETYLGQSAPAVRLNGPLSLPHMTNLRGRILAGTRDVPLAVKGPYGLGTVTLVALELNREPFLSWEGRTDFWLKLLAIPKQSPQDTTQRGGGAWNQRSLTDLSSHLRLQIELFQGIGLVSFQWVAFFIFLYILLIGPVDYWFVKHRLKRMELTWVTFPATVIIVSLGAYIAAYWLKGDVLRINKVDVVDVDQATGTLRGTSWFTLFSPQIKNYSIKVEPELASVPEPPNQPGGPAVTVSWLGLAENSIGGMGRSGGVGLFRRGYRFGPDAQTLVDVPVQVWSMKDFSSRWHGQASATVDAKLQVAGADRLRGSVTNRLSMPLQDCVLAFGNRVYPLGNLPPGGSVLAESSTTEDLKGHVTRRAEISLGGRMTGQNPTPPQWESQFNPYDLVFTMMFYERLPEGNQYGNNDYFSDMDLSDQLDHQRAILVARVPGKGSKLFLNGNEANQNVNAACFLRIILPVTNAAAESGVER